MNIQKNAQHQISYHSDNGYNMKPAINVKDHETYWASNSHTRELIDTLGNEIANEVYESLQWDFWREFAPEIADEYGYGQVYSEGRSGGWLVVENPPDLDDNNVIQITQWLEFAKEIDELVKHLQSQYPVKLQEKLDEIRAEDSEKSYNESRDIVTVERIPF